jgi:hypothetical protein
MKTAREISAGSPTLRQLLPPSDNTGVLENAVLRTAIAIIAKGMAVAAYFPPIAWSK